MLQQIFKDSLKLKIKTEENNTSILKIEANKRFHPFHNKKPHMPKNHNPVVYFEIPVKDLDRAIKFYNEVFNFEFNKTVIDGNEMALFPFKAEISGISGALVKGEIYKPTIEGVIIYFRTEDIEANLNLATKHGGAVLYPKTSNGELGFVAEFKDSEGNRIALHQLND